jgi:hypothetical protein
VTVAAAVAWATLSWLASREEGEIFVLEIVLADPDRVIVARFEAKHGGEIDPRRGALRCWRREISGSATGMIVLRVRLF